MFYHIGGKEEKQKQHPLGGFREMLLVASIMDNQQIVEAVAA